MDRPAATKAGPAPTLAAATARGRRASQPDRCDAKAPSALKTGVVSATARRPRLSPRPIASSLSGPFDIQQTG